MYICLCFKKMWWGKKLDFIKEFMDLGKKIETIGKLSYSKTSR